MSTKDHAGEERAFPTDAVLSTITGYLVASKGIGAIYEVLNWMTGEDVYTHQIPRISREARALMVKLRPELAAAVSESVQITADNWSEWLALWVDRYGPTIVVPKMGPDQHERIDPLSELAEMVPPEKIIVVKT